MLLYTGVEFIMKIIFIDYRAANKEKENLGKLGYKVLTVPPNNNLYEAVCGHPDMLLHILNENTIIVHKDMDLKFIDFLKSQNINVIFSEKSLSSNYPLDIILNAVNLDNIFMHNIKYTDSVLLKMIKHKKIINVKQGYSKCSTAIVSNNAVMTSDKKIAKSLYEEGIDVLLLPPGDILLPYLNYGFIGGCCGLLEDNIIAFYGDLHNYLYGKDVFDFLKKHKVEPVFLSKGKLIDRGSILTI